MHFRSQSSSVRFWLASVTLACTASAIACGSSKGSTAQSPSPDTWATVDGRSISRDDVEKAFRRSQDPGATLSAEEAMTAKLSLLNEMILQDILLARARAQKIEVTDGELDNAYNERRKNMSEEQFQEELKKRNLTAADMREGLRRELTMQKLIDQDVIKKVSVSDQEITDFYNANRAQFTVAEESYRIAQIVVTPQRGNGPMNRTGNDATSAEEATFKVRMIMERLKAGAPFGDVAMDYSEDPESAPRGGDLRSELPPGADDGDEVLRRCREEG